MANAGPNTNASQFFVTYAKAPHLNGKNAVFGKVIDGFGVLDQIEKTPGDERDRPLRDIKIEGHCTPTRSRDAFARWPPSRNEV